MNQKIESITNYILAYYNGTLRATYDLVNNDALENNDYKDNIEKEFYLTNLKLQKLLYYCQGVHLAYENKKLFDEKIVAFEYGPVVQEVYDAYKTFKGEPIKYADDLTFSLDDSEKETIRFVVENFGGYDEWRLVEETHKSGSPWHTAHSKKNDTFDNIELDINEIKQYFKERIVEI